MRELRHETYDLLIMDWELPEKSGVEVLSWLRGDREWDLPVFFITHRDGESDIIEALEKGADDYLAKPVNREIMLARIRALVRRHSGRRDHIEVSGFTLQKENKTLTLNGEPVEMTEKEFQLAWMLFTQYWPPAFPRPSVGKYLGIWSGSHDPYCGYSYQPLAAQTGADT